MPPPARMPASTSSAPNMRPSPPSRPRRSGWRRCRRRPDGVAAGAVHAAGPAAMKAAKGGLAEALDRPDPPIRFYLFHGPDEAGSRALADRAAEGPWRAEKFVGARPGDQGRPGDAWPMRPAQFRCSAASGRSGSSRPATRLPTASRLCSSAGLRKPGDRRGRFAAQDLGPAQAGRSASGGAVAHQLCARGPRSGAAGGRPGP